MNDNDLNELKGALRNAEEGLIHSLQTVKHLLFQVAQIQDIATELRNRNAKDDPKSST